VAHELLDLGRMPAWLLRGMWRTEELVRTPAFLGAAAIVTVVMSGAAVAGQTPPAPAQSSASAQGATTPAEFVRTVSTGSTKEIEMGKLASQKAAGADVRGFANRMVNDHTNALAELSALATKKSWAVSTDPASHKAALNKMSAAYGAAFDRAYMEMMVTDHQKTAALFEAQAKSGADPELKAWAAKTLVTVQDHLKQAREIVAKMSK
jgi:putative membrane protein